MPDIHYENARLAELYDADCPWNIERDFYLSLAGPPRQSILDLGCGTGLLCDAYAAIGHDVTGVDPSQAMLDVARRKPHGKNIAWVQSSAQAYRSDKSFDLIIMTGNAFQVLLEDSDILATFSMMRRHLASNGLVAFETRNPAIDWVSLWNYDMDIELPDAVVRESRHFIAMNIAMNNGRMTFDLRYRFPNETLISSSELRFSSPQTIERLLHASGLRIEHLLGDWDGKPFDERSSQEMVFLVRAGTDE